MRADLLPASAAGGVFSREKAAGCRLLRNSRSAIIFWRFEAAGAKQAAEKARTKSEFGKGWIGRG